eukprot:UN33104
MQILDLPGIIQGAAQGEGRGKEVIAVARSADLIIMMVDAVKSEVQIPLLTKELNACGIRLNQIKPNISFTKTKQGMISFNAVCQLTHCDEKFVKDICQIYKIPHAEVVFREDATQEQFIDVVVGNRLYKPCLYVHNKIDNTTMDEVKKVSRL